MTRVFRRLMYLVGVAFYTSVATASAAAPEALRPDAATALLLHLDGQVRDASANACECRCAATAFAADGVVGDALRAEGGEGCVFPSTCLPDLSGGFTVEAWLRMPRPDDARFGRVLELPGCFTWTMNTYSRGRAKIDFKIVTDTGAATMKTVEYLPCATWVHVACTYDPAAAGLGRLALYVNTVHTDRLTRYQTRSAPEGALCAPAGDLILARGFVGDIDEVRISVPARAPAELGGRWLSGVTGVFDLKAMQWSALAARPAGRSAEMPWFVEAVAIPTFEAVGIRLKADRPLAADATASVRYRAAAGSWRGGMDLTCAPRDPELRGSLLGLEADTEYEIEVVPRLGAGIAHAPIRLTARTWRETVPIGRTVHLPAGGRTEPLIVEEKGTPDAWVKICPPDGEDVTVDGGEADVAAVRFRGAEYVVLERVTVRGGRRHGIEITDSHHVRVRGCDISGWGRVGVPGEDGIRRTVDGDRINYDAGVYIGPGSGQVVVEHCVMHRPRGTANSWEFGHPVGPQGIVIANSQGNHVIRYNDIVGSETHWWNDAIESVSNAAVTGGPYRDTDIYGNILFFSNDDGTELDGGQINVRYHHNWVEKALCGVSCAPCLSGPSYLYRNVFAHLGDERGRRGSAFKMGGGPRYSPGLNVIFHNTVYGRAGGLRSVGFGEENDEYHRGGYHAFARNNLFAGPTDGVHDVTDKSTVPVSSFDYDLLGRGGALVAPGNERHAVRAKPVFRGEDTGDYRLAPESPGVDAGIHIPGMNDGFAGAAPEPGAFETDASAVFPPRPHGVSIRPPRLVAVRFLGSDRGQGGEVSLSVPREAGSSWQAIPNSDWLHCEPETGSSSEEPLRIRVGWNLDTQGPALRRGAVTFRTDRGYVRTVPVDIHIYHDPVEIFLEGETGERSGEMVAAADVDASGGAYVHVPIPPEELEGEERIRVRGAVTFTVVIPRQGEYYLAARALAPEPSGLHDSFFVSWDDSEPVLWHVRVQDRWAWTRLPEPVDLAPGRHTLRIQSRETGTRLDRVLVTNNPVAGPVAEVLPATGRRE